MSKSNNSRWLLIYIHWEEWGHKSADCDGAGLCLIQACVDCEVYDVIPNHTGPLNYDDETKKGYLTIALDPNDAKEKSFIVNKETFYIDDDLSFAGGYLVAGQYTFDPNIGSYGGYTIPAVMN